MYHHLCNDLPFCFCANGIRTLIMNELKLGSEKHSKILRKYEADREKVEKLGNGNHRAMSNRPKLIFYSVSKRHLLSEIVYILYVHTLFHKLHMKYGMYIIVQGATYIHVW